MGGVLALTTQAESLKLSEPQSLTTLALIRRKISIPAVADTHWCPCWRTGPRQKSRVLESKLAAGQKPFQRSNPAATAPGLQCAQHSKGGLKLERHKDFLKKKKQRKQRAGIGQGQEKNRSARTGEWRDKTQLPLICGKAGGWADENGGTLPGSSWYPTFPTFRVFFFLKGSNNPADMRKFLNAL